MTTTPDLLEARRLPLEGALRLTWSDGHVAEYPYGYLRGYCPCAMCQGHNALEVVFHPPGGPVALSTIEPVGLYGLSLGFSDGHSTGIYRFDFLRSLCPCATCRPLRREAAAATASASAASFAVHSPANLLADAHFLSPGETDS